jgi:paraquat-inducible protein A
VWVPIASIELLVCWDCDAVHRQVSLRKREIACCTACGALLARHSRLAVEQLLALTLTAAILFLIANANPVLAIEVGGMRTEANGWTAALSMAHGWMGWAAAVLAVTVFVVPMLQIAMTLWVLSFAWLARRAPGLRHWSGLGIRTLNAGVRCIHRCGQRRFQNASQILYRARESATADAWSERQERDSAHR